MDGQVKRGRGRPAVYLDGADRQAAHRERQGGELAKGKMLAKLIERPTPAFVAMMIQRLLDQSADPAASRAAVMRQLAAGAGTETE